MPRNIEKTCKQCVEAFAAVMKRAEFCCGKCRVKWWAERSGREAMMRRLLVDYECNVNCSHVVIDAAKHVVKYEWYVTGADKKEIARGEELSRVLKDALDVTAMNQGLRR